MPEALAWLSAVSADPNDEHLHLWRVLAALRAGEWETARRFIAALPEEQQREGRWVYWKARSLEVGGKKREAENFSACWPANAVITVFWRPTGYRQNIPCSTRPCRPPRRR